MIDIQVKGNKDPDALAELIASTLHGHMLTAPHANVALVGKLVRTEQERAEQRRASRHDLETVDFKLIDDDLDFSDL